MSGTAAIALIVVVWLFVLAPLALRGQKPIRRTNEAFDETRVIYEGGSGRLPTPRRPKFMRRDVRPETPQAEVAAEVVDPEDVLIDDSPRPASVADNSVMEIDGDVVQELDRPAAVAPEQQPETDRSDSADDQSEDAQNASPGENLDVRAEIDDTDEDTDSGEVYRLDSYYSSPADLLHPGADYASADEVSERESVTETAEEDSDYGDAEITDEDREFAASRRGRGWYDPEADANVASTRYQRRTRTLIGLSATVVVGLILGFVVGGWMWLVPTVAGVLTVLYLVELRRQVRQEHDLRARRIQHLRRARLGVRTDRDEEMGVPQRLRHPGAIVLDTDDESPDFEYLETRSFDNDYYDDYTYDQGISYDYREPRRVS